MVDARLLDNQKHQITVDKYTAAYTILGEGEPIIFLHGFFGDGWTLKPVMEKLQANHSCLGLELLGFGDSSKPKLRYIVDHQVEFLHRFLQAKKIRKFYLVGYSYGAWVAAAYAIAAANLELNSLNTLDCHQDINNESINLTGLSLIAPAGIRDDSFVGRYNHLKPLLWETKLVDFALDVISPLASLVGKSKNFQEIRLTRSELIRQPAAKSLLCDRLRPEDAIDTVENDIHRINVPTLAIAGGADRRIPLWHTQTYAERIPQAQLEIIPDADHDIVQTHSQEVSSLIKQHLLTVTGRTQELAG